MQPTAANGKPTSAREILDSLRQEIDRLEAELQRQQKEIETIRAERDDLRAVVYVHLKKRFDPKVWDNFDPSEYSFTIDDLLADLKKT